MSRHGACVKLGRALRLCVRVTKQIKINLVPFLSSVFMSFSVRDLVTVFSCLFNL